MKDASLLQVVFERCSVRDFDAERQVSAEVGEKILLAGISAPSAGNIQPRTFIIVDDEAVRAQLYELCEGQAFMNDAALWIVVCADVDRHMNAARLTGVSYDYTGVLPFTFSVLDAALSLENMVVAAGALGLGSVIIGSVIEHPERVKRILKLPRHCLALSILCVGYPRRKPVVRAKWDYKVIVCRNEYKHVEANDVLAYWERFILSDLKRSGKRATLATVERWLKQGKQANYGAVYADHYKQDFIWKTNKKLATFLKRQGFL